MFGQLSIETARFARERTQIEGALSVAEMPRLAQQLFDTIGSLTYRVGGYVTDRGDPALTIRIEGSVNLCCQRCLERLPWRLELKRDLVLVSGADEFEPQQDDEDDSVDIVPAAPRLDLQALLEEEIMLGLPMAPRHAEGECRAPGEVKGGEERQASAFAGLASLKR